MRILVPILLALANCGTATPGNETGGGGNLDSATLAKLSLTSDAFANGQRIPSRFTCDGVGERPTLHWTDPPPGVRSFALVVDDPDAPSGTFRHWGVYDIPATARSIGAGQAIGTEVSNDFGKPGYGGPCPPTGHGAHHYYFKLLALDIEKLGLPANAKVKDLEDAARAHAIAQGELVATYER
jgi:Raf kinase inhibitor-like YbhB/YbcL family protein